MMNEITKGILLLIAMVVLWSFLPAEAGMTCTKDYFGNTTCTTDSGQQWQGSRDYFGSDNWRSNDGRTMQCSTDYWGNYICN